MNSTEPTRRNDPGRGPAWDVPSRRCGLIACGLLPAMIVLTLAHAAAPTASGVPATTVHSLDPDTAPWWELTALPRFGPALAFEVVRYRESVRKDAPDPLNARVFNHPADLAKVRGIGPVTVRRIAPYLRFKPQ